MECDIRYTYILYGIRYMGVACLSFHRICTVSVWHLYLARPFFMFFFFTHTLVALSVSSEEGTARKPTLVLRRILAPNNCTILSLI